MIQMTWRSSFMFQISLDGELFFLYVHSLSIKPSCELNGVTCNDFSRPSLSLMIIRTRIRKVQENNPLSFSTCPFSR